LLLAWEKNLFVGAPRSILERQAVNISSAILHARPGGAEALQQRLMGLPGVEVHAVSPDGKLVITIETPDDGETTKTFEAINMMEEVLSAAMVYHQTESDPDKELSYETDAA
jgi:nitrate reductase NapD